MFNIYNIEVFIFLKLTTWLKICCYVFFFIEDRKWEKEKKKKDWL